MEIYKEVKTYRVVMKCDKCKQGEMKPTNRVFPVFPEQFEHQCDCCGYRTSYKIVYPTIEYKEIEGPEEKPAKENPEPIKKKK